MNERNPIALIELLRYEFVKVQPRTSVLSSSERSSDGDGEVRTLDPLLARQVLSQLSYIPTCFGALLFSRVVSNKVPSAVQGLTVVFGMGTGVSPARIDTRTVKL